MSATLDWLGVATFRLQVDGLTIFLDAYMDRVPAAPPVGLTTAEVDRADFILVGHSHFDHLWGAERIARNTGATIIGSHETARLMTEEEVPEQQLIAVAGGERVRLSDNVSVRVFPSQHSCIWASMSGGPDEVCLGDRGLTLQERQSNLQARQGRRGGDERPGMAEVRAHLGANRQRPRGEGGAFAYLIETPEGSILWKDTSGHWTGILRDLRPDVALLAAAGRGNIDGEPVQGSLAEFMAREADLLRPRRIVLSHHDDWLPPTTSPPNVAPIRKELERQTPGVELVEMGYSEGYPILRGVR
ncbi:MAG TPA: MBL fold metallo-hydrolase [Dehalococcoidia bacterium]|nr:MBL fold metallo-hydrolase [Dehalococcoidia bacterium]